MTTTIDRKEREWQGNADADAETIDEHCDFDDRLDLAAEIRAAMLPDRGAVAALARDCRVTTSAISDVIHARKGVSPALLSRIADALSVDAATQDRWHALAQHVAPDLTATLLAHPERWAAVRALLDGGDHG